MTKLPFQMKNLVDEWSKNSGYIIKDTTKEIGAATIEWALEISNGVNSVIVFTEKKLQDVLRFQTIIDFSPEHQKQTATFSDGDFNSFVLEITDRLANLGCNWIFNHDSQNHKQMKSLAMTYFVVYENVDRNVVLQILNKAFINLAQMVRAISITLNKNADPKVTSSQANANKSMYG